MLSHVFLNNLVPKMFFHSDRIYRMVSLMCNKMNTSCESLSTETANVWTLFKCIFNYFCQENSFSQQLHFYKCIIKWDYSMNSFRQNLHLLHWLQVSGSQWMHFQVTRSTCLGSYFNIFNEDKIISSTSCVHYHWSFHIKVQAIYHYATYLNRFQARNLHSKTPGSYQNWKHFCKLYKLPFIPPKFPYDPGSRGRSSRKPQVSIPKWSYVQKTKKGGE